MANNCGLNIATAIQEKIYIVPETVCGELALPDNSGNQCVLLIDPIDFNSSSELLADKQLRPNRSRRMPMLGRVNPAEYTVKTYVKPSGQLGVEPQEGLLLKHALGKVNVVANQYVEYLLESYVDSFSLWINLGHTVYAISGCTVNELRFEGAGDREAEYTFSGNGMKLYRATISKSNSTTDTSNEIHIVNPEFFTPEMPIYLIDNTSGNVYGRSNPFIITDVVIDTTNGTNHKLVLDREVGFTSTDVTVMPYIPENCVDFGYPQFGKYGITQLNNQPMIITSWTVSLNNNIKYYENEKNGVPFATSYGVIKAREIDVEVEAYFRPELASFYYKHFTLSKDTVVIPVGDTDGSICEWIMPEVVWEAPNYTGNEEVSVRLKGQAVSTSADGNDELKIVYR